MMTYKDSKTMIFCVNVDRSLTQQQVLRSLNLKENVDNGLIKTFPEGGIKKEEITFFSVGRKISDDTLKIEYESRGLKPVDFYSIAAVNKAHPKLAICSRNATHWQNINKLWCCAAFVSLSESRNDSWVCIHHNVTDWMDYWWFVGKKDNKIRLEIKNKKEAKNLVPCYS